LRGSYTFSDFLPDVIRLIFRNILILSLGYIGEFEEVDDHRSGKIVIQLNGRYAPTNTPNRLLLTPLDSLNKTGVISPRYNVRLTDLEKWVVKLLPSRQFGYMVLTTSAGIMDHEEARRKHVAGKIIGFFY
jgi:small subunit ribosomal protein S15Ae